MAASDKLSQELVKVHEEYDDVAKRKQAEKQELREKMDGADEPEAEDPSAEWEMVDEKERKILTSDMEPPCTLKLAVWSDRNNGKVQLRATDENGKETRIPIGEDVMADLDSSDPWPDLYVRVGLSSDGKVVLAQLVGQKEKTISGIQVLCKVQKYDKLRYYVGGTSLATANSSTYIICKDELEAEEEVMEAINAGADGDELFELLLSRMSFEEEDGFAFGRDD